MEIRIPYGKKYITEVTSHTCSFHEKHPGVAYAGCTCSAAYSQELVDDPNPPKTCTHCDGTGIEKGTGQNIEGYNYGFNY